MKIGIIAYRNNSGLGNLAKNLYENLEMDSWYIINHSLKGINTDNLTNFSIAPNDFNIKHFEKYLDTYTPDVMVIIETPFNWEYLPLLKKRGIKVVYIPMIDCVRFDEIKYKDCVDTWIMLNKLGHSLALAARGINNIYQLNYAVDTNYFEFKERTGTTFVHNAGYYELIKGQADAHKGTDLVIDVFACLPQYKLLLRSMTNVPFFTPFNKTFVSDIRDLYKDGDIYLAPSRWEGLGLPLYEAMASGMVLMTTNAPPMSEFSIDDFCKINCTPFSIPHGTGVGYNVNINDFIFKIYNIVNQDIPAISRKNRKIIEEHYSWDVLKSKYLEVMNG